MVEIGRTLWRKFNLYEGELTVQCLEKAYLLPSFELEVKKELLTATMGLKRL